MAARVFLARERYAPFLVLGWELLLSSYSYCHDQAERAEPLALGPSGLMIALWSLAGRSAQALSRAAPDAFVRAAASRVGLGLALIAAAVAWG